MNYIKLPSALILCFLLIFTSCGSDDDNNSGVTASIIGAWLYTSSTYNGENDELIECESLSTIIFSDTQLFSTEYYGDDCALTDTYTETYSIDGNTISITYENETYTSEIVTLNDTTLTIKDMDGADEYTYTYTRQ